VNNVFGTPVQVFLLFPMGRSQRTDLLLIPFYSGFEDIGRLVSV